MPGALVLSIPNHRIYPLRSNDLFFRVSIFSSQYVFNGSNFSEILVRGSNDLEQVYESYHKIVAVSVVDMRSGMDFTTAECV